MKRLLLALMVTTLVLCVCACSSGSNRSNEERGVPHQQVESDVFPSSLRENYTVIDFDHDVDTVLHQDNVTITYCSNYKYMRTDFVQSLVYQYDCTTDIWTLLSRGERNHNYTLFDSLKDTQWTGTSDAGWGLTVYYDITVNEINTIDGWIHFSYDIYFDKKNFTGTGYMQYGEFELSNVDWIFDIIFNPDEGFKAIRN